MSVESGTRERLSNGTGKKVLVIDDSELALRALRDALERFGFEVVVRSTAIGAPAAVLRERPDVVLIDRTMPIVPGDELVRALRNRAELRDTVILLCSADDERTMTMASAACGADGWVSKEQDAHALVRAVLKHLRTVRTATEQVIAACGTWRGAELVRTVRTPSVIHTVESGSEALKRMTSSPAPRVAIIGNGLNDLEPRRVLAAAARADASWAQRMIILREIDAAITWADECEVISVDASTAELEEAVTRARLAANRALGRENALSRRRRLG
jgi:DNA-binding response OmpR family regulator